MENVFLKDGGTFDSLNLRYRPIDETSADVLVRWRSDPETIRYYQTPVLLTKEKHLYWYFHVYLQDKTRFDWVAWYGPQAIGVVSLTDMDFAEHSCQIGYAIGEVAYRGRHLSEEMIQAVMEHGQDHFGMKRFLATVHYENIASQKAVLRNGFRVEAQTGNFWQYSKIENGGGYRLNSLYLGAVQRRVLAA